MQKKSCCEGETILNRPHDKKYVQYIIIKENLKRVRSVSLVLAFVNLLLLVLNVVKIQTNSYATSMGTFLMLAFFYGSSFIIKTRKRQWYQNTYLLFWFVLTGIFFAQFQLNSTLYSHIIYISYIILLGVIPLLDHKERIVIWLLQLVMFGGMYDRQRFEQQEFLYIIELSIVGFLLATTRFYSKMKEIHNGFDLNSAIALSEQDAMTGLLNRRGLERNIFPIWPHCIRQSLSVAVIMLDIDNFKKYNDTFGHLKGDICIKKIGDQIKKTARRKTDIVARIGGEEFVVFLSGVESKEAISWALQLQKNIETMGIPHSSNSIFPIVTVSMGIYCGVPQQDSQFYEYRDMADANLYRAKENGRACIIYDGACYGKKSISDYHKMNREFMAEKRRMLS